MNMTVYQVTERVDTCPACHGIGEFLMNAHSEHGIIACYERPCARCGGFAEITFTEWFIERCASCEEEYEVIDAPFQLSKEDKAFIEEHGYRIGKCNTCY
ncbi:hypothetical protein [Desertibacillus haloalkaliphilus]|uniref:hypothetical protein n=1 Tax=Desertibacillus haloalkaliphilus TaxID=1328930 RepID=UPI001C26027B|nr:hypothetical protein [Desertibacillus haloalkaliphilus]MBU8908158.1 hypothetical protein [Desertibacillus haloalkaliphilus]